MFHNNAMEDRDKPRMTGGSHPLPFEKLAPLEFERLCLWLVRREGYERAEHLGEAGSEQGRDVLAWKDGRRVVFQCKLAPASTQAETQRLGRSTHSERRYRPTLKRQRAIRRAILAGGEAIEHGHGKTAEVFKLPKFSVGKTASAIRPGYLADVVAVAGDPT